MNTYDRLADPKNRTITTRMPTGEHTSDGEAVLTLMTSHNKRGKCIDSDLYVEHRDEDGFYIRSFTLFQRSAGAGITLNREPIARYNQSKVRAQHEDTLRALTTRSALSHDDPVEAELARLLHLAMTTA